MAFPRDPDDPNQSAFWLCLVDCLAEYRKCNDYCLSLPNKPPQPGVECLDNCLKAYNDCMAACQATFDNRIVFVVPSVKDAYQDLSDEYWIVSGRAPVVGAVATLVLGLTGAGLIAVGFAGIATAAMTDVAIEMAVKTGRLARDPPDANYGQLAAPRPIRWGRSPTLKGVPANLVKSVRTLFDNQAKTAAYLEAFVTAVERSQGASLAQDQDAGRRQLVAAKRYGRNAAQRLELAADLRRDLRDQCRKQKLQFSFTDKQFARAKKTAMSNSFLRELTDKLATRYSEADMQSVITLWKSRVELVKPSDLRFPESLVNPALIRFEKKAAAELRAFVSSLRF